MPQWLSNQLMRAFHKKDSRQIKLLNECWFFYRSRPGNVSGMQNNEPGL
ncbi:cortex morphogenetic protein CmpA [Neobacillus mesonae]|nr:cortex morphogenetic protein CmpA [Neobacillus mesonae]